MLYKDLDRGVVKCDSANRVGCGVLFDELSVATFDDAPRDQDRFAVDVDCIPVKSAQFSAACSSRCRDVKERRQIWVVVTRLLDEAG